MLCIQPSFHIPELENPCLLKRVADKEILPQTMASKFWKLDVIKMSPKEF